MRVCVIGAGYVGVTTAAVLAEEGHAVDLVEVDAAKRNALAGGSLPFHEPGLPRCFANGLASKRIRLHESIQVVRRPAHVILLCVGTPMKPDGQADLRFVEAAAGLCARKVRAWRTPVVVATKSTVPPGTGREIVAGAIRRMRATAYATVASNPEFLSEGNALKEARSPDRIVLGVDDAKAEGVLRRLYASARCPVLVVDVPTAETIKYAANAMLATRVAFANEIGNLCERLGVNVDHVMKGVGLDDRIGPRFLRAGLGFGGSCFPKDVSAFQALGRRHHVAMGILDAVLANNELQPRRAIELLQDLGGALRGRRIAVLGLAFKPHTSDVRETRALPIIRALRRRGAHVVAHDPVAAPAYRALDGGQLEVARSAAAALRGADGCILVTEWPEYGALPPRAFASMKRRIVVDGRRALNGPELEKRGVRYAAVGVGRV